MIKAVLKPSQYVPDCGCLLKETYKKILQKGQVFITWFLPDIDFEGETIFLTEKIFIIKLFCWFFFLGPAYKF